MLEIFIIALFGRMVFRFVMVIVLVIYYYNYYGYRYSSHSRLSGDRTDDFCLFKWSCSDDCIERHILTSNFDLSQLLIIHMIFDFVGNH